MRAPSPSNLSAQSTQMIWGVAVLDLQLQQQTSWERGSRVWSRGRAFQDGTLLDAKRLADVFEQAQDVGALAELARQLNGHFAVVGESQQGLYAVVDRARSFPLFYSTHDGRAHFSDSALPLAPKRPVRPSLETLLEFAYCGYVTGEDTLVPEVSQLEPASLVWVPRTEERGAAAQVVTYDAFVPTIRGTGLSEDTMLQKLHATMVASVGRLIEVANGRTIVIPLSGGYDSRLIAMILRLAGYENVVCFSYGRPGNKESAISKTVAEELGYRWLFVPYDEQKWKYWVASPEWRDYLEMAHLGVALPLVQGWPCVGSLLEEGVVPKDSVFAPGYYGGGLFAGYFSRPDLVGSRRVSADSVAEKLVTRMFWAWGDPDRQRSDLADAPSHIAKQLLPPDGETWEAEAAAYESWIYRNYEVKFMGNASRYYDYWGVDWWFPFADKDVFSFWQSVPYSKRLYNALNIKYVTQHTADLLDIPQTSIMRQIKAGHPRPWGLRAQARTVADRIDKSGVLKRLKNRGQQASAPLDLDQAYNGHPLAWWGAVDRQMFDTYYTGRESAFPFMARQMLQERYDWSFETGFGGAER